MATPNFNDETMIGLFREIAAKHLYEATHSPIFRMPLRYPHIDERGCYRFRAKTFFEAMTPRGRLVILNSRARRKREGFFEIKFTTTQIGLRPVAQR